MDENRIMVGSLTYLIDKSELVWGVNWGRLGLAQSFGKGCGPCLTLMYAPVSRPFHIVAAPAETLPLLPLACPDVYRN